MSVPAQPGYLHWKQPGRNRSFYDLDQDELAVSTQKKKNRQEKKSRRWIWEYENHDCCYSYLYAAAVPAEGSGIHQHGVNRMCADGGNLRNEMEYSDTVSVHRNKLLYTACNPAVPFSCKADEHRRYY